MNPLVKALEDIRDACTDNETSLDMVRKIEKITDNALSLYSQSKPERFKRPTDQQVVKAAILFNDGNLEPEKLSDMVALCEFVIDRLYENGDMLIPSSKEK